MGVRPLLSCKVELDQVKFPIYVSTKFDGIRALVIDGVVYSRSLRPIRNTYVQNMFGKDIYNGFDGELVVGDIYASDVFQKTTSGVMSMDGVPDVSFYVFDLWSEPDMTYEERQRHLVDLLIEDGHMKYENVHYVTNHECYSIDDVEYHLNHERHMGGEGLIGRNPQGKYKYGRSTLKDQLSIKFKFFEQGEFEVIGFTEGLHNTNEQKRDNLGYADRSTSKLGMIAKDTLGSLVLRYKDTQFSCGTGFDDDLRQEIWDNQEKYLGKLASVRYMSVGSKYLPRVPSFQGFRHVDDIG